MKRSRFRTVPLTRLAVAALASISMPAHAGTYANDFNGTNPFDPGLPDDQRLKLFVTQFRDSAPGGPNYDPAHVSFPGWSSTGGVDGSGFMRLNDPTNGTRSIIVFPDFEEGFAVNGFTFSVDCRIGGGTTDPADGFSINFARAGNPLITTGDGGWIDGAHENGANTGIAIGFDSYGGNRGIRVSVDGTFVAQYNFVNNGGAGDLTTPQYMQTGPRSASGEVVDRIAALGWAEAKVELIPNPDPEALTSHILNIWWKGVNVIPNLGVDYNPGSGRLIFGARTGGQNQAHHFDNISLETISLPQATLTSATVSHDEGFTFTIADFGTESVVTPGDINEIVINGYLLESSEYEATKADGVTTIRYMPSTPFTPRELLNYSIEFTDSNNATIFAQGTLTAPIFPAGFFLTEEPQLNLWNIREIRGPFSTGANIDTALGIAANPPATPGDDPPGTGVIVDYTAPFMNMSDDFAGAFGTRGFFKRDAVIRTNNALATPAGTSVDDNDIVALGRTKIQVAEAGDYTFWVQGDDGFVLRVNGGSFHKVVGPDLNAVIDPTDSSTIAYMTGTGNSNTRGVVHLDAGVEYVLDYLWVEGTGGAFAEVAWAAGDHADNPVNGKWTLVGGEGETPFFPAGPLAEPALPAGGGWAVRNYYNGGAIANLRAAFNLIANPGEASIADAETPVVNFQDPQGANLGSGGLFNNDIPFPLDTPADDNQFVTVGRCEVNIPAAGDYTFAITADDGVALRVLGGPWLIEHAGPMNNNSGADPLDSTAFLNTNNSGDTTFGVYRVTEPGTYIVEVVHAEGSGGAAVEVAWAPGRHTHRNNTSAWQLVGDPGDPSLPALVPVLPNDALASLPRTEDGNWSVRFIYSTTEVGSLAAAYGVVLNPGAATIEDETIGFLNYFNRPTSDIGANPGGTAQGLFRANNAAPYNLTEALFPGPGVTAYRDDVVALATSRVVIPTSGVYTFGVNSDDGFALRIVGAPNGFRRLSGTATTLIDMAQPNTIYRSGGTAGNRAVIELPAGEYDIEFAFYERGGGAGFELFAAAGDFTEEGDTNTWRLIGDTNNGGLGLVAQFVDPGPGDDTLSISSFDFDPATGDFSFTWGSEEAGAYDIEYSTDLVTWYSLEANYPGGEGATTTYTGNISDLTEIEDTDKVFFRLRTVD